MKSQPWASQTASRIFIRHEASVDSRPTDTQRALLPRLLLGSGISSAGSISSFVPRPVHAGQAPCGELNENDARLELVDREAVVRAAVLLAVALLLEVGRPSSRGAGAISTTPSPRRSAVSIESARRAASGSGIDEPGLGVDRPAVVGPRRASGASAWRTM